MTDLVNRLVAVIAIVALTAAPVVAGPKERHVQVLPLDGNADAPTRAKLTTSVQKLARVIEGQVKPGVTTFADTALAAGCDPSTAACAESVRTQLGVDELVWGTATVANGTVTVVVRRKSGSDAPRQVTATFQTGEAPDRIEPKLLPLFSGSSGEVTPPKCGDGSEPDASGTCQPAKQPACPEGQTRGADGTCAAAPAKTCPNNATPGADGACPTCANGSTPEADGSCPTVTPKQPISRDRALGLGATIGGGVLLLVGIGLWRSKDRLQTAIDNHPTDSVSDFQDLQRIEDSAGSRALYGNLLVAGGLALAGVGAWWLWRDHKARLSVTPAPVEGGATVTVTWIGGLR